MTGIPGTATTRSSDQRASRVAASPFMWAWFHSDSKASSIAVVESVFARLTMDTMHNTKLTKTCVVRGTIILLIVNSCSAENNESAIRRHGPRDSEESSGPPRLAVYLTPESCDDHPDDCATGCAQSYDGPVRFRDDRIWNAKQQAEDQSYEPTGPREPGGTDYKADPESGNECSRECGLFIRERHRKHDSDIPNFENKRTTCPETK